MDCKSRQKWELAQFKPQSTFGNRLWPVASSSSERWIPKTPIQPTWPSACPSAPAGVSAGSPLDSCCWVAASLDGASATSSRSTTHPTPSPTACPRPSSSPARNVESLPSFTSGLRSKRIFRLRSAPSRRCSFSLRPPECGLVRIVPDGRPGAPDERRNPFLVSLLPFVPLPFVTDFFPVCASRCLMPFFPGAEQNLRRPAVRASWSQAHACNQEVE